MFFRRRKTRISLLAAPVFNRYGDMPTELPAWELIEDLLRERFSSEWASARSVWVGQPDLTGSL